MAIVFNNLSAGGGSKLYEHSLSLYVQGNNSRINIKYLNNDPTPFTIETFKALNNTQLFNTSGFEVHTEKNILQHIKAYYLENGNLYYRYQKISFTITDNIITWSVNPNLLYSSIITIYSLDDAVREL